jgi:hypothetical protein
MALIFQLLEHFMLMSSHITRAMLGSDHHMLVSYARLLALLLMVWCGRSVEDGIVTGSREDHQAIYGDYPTAIYAFKPRVDPHSRQPVERGRLEVLGGIHAQRKVSLQDFRQLLQCAPSEPGIEGSRAPLSFLRLIPPRRETIELMVVYQQTNCYPWKDCQDLLQQWRSNASSYHNLTSCTVPLIRVMNGEIYEDYPFFPCYSYHTSDINHYYAHWMVLNKVADIPDSVFFQGNDTSASEYKFPFAVLSNGPSLKSMDMSYVWVEELFREMKIYERNYPRSDDDESDRSPAKTSYSYPNYHSIDYESWQKRISKAAYHGSMSGSSQVIFDWATARPDLIDARWTNAKLEIPTNPLSQDDPIDIDSIHDFSRKKDDAKVGSLTSLLKYRRSEEWEDQLYSYKFIIVCASKDNRALDGRLNHILAHSGAVVLLQTTDMEYHYSARLKPWIHYVPVSFNNADIIRKLIWLQSHDEMAYQIARNAKFFADSYLRLEDYYCYIAALQESLGGLFNQHQSSKDALLPFNATKLNIPTQWQRKA